MRIWIFSLVICIGVTMLQTTPVQAGGSVTLSTYRVEFEGRKRTEQIYLLNQSDQAATYRISLQNMRMLEDGSLEDVETPLPGEPFADNLIRFSPRQVTIPPNGKQSVRLMVRKPADLAPGEYRTHMMFLGVSESKANNIEQFTEQDSVVPVVTSNFAITIPVFVRHGEGDVEAAITELNLGEEPYSEGTRPTLDITVQREGLRTLYAHCRVMLQDTDGNVERVGGKGIAVYYPGTIQKLKVPLSVTIDSLAPGHKLIAQLYRNGDNGQEIVLSEQNFQL